jgi:predicted LPLAT superfamily acyltransferase
MGFDVEILVRALWSGISMINVPTRVTYPVGGLSHFKYGADNVCLARLYSKLAVEGMWRVPARWLRRLCLKEDEAREWHQIAERGSLLGLRSLLFVLEKVGRGPLTIVLAPVVIHMFVWGRLARTSARDFQKHIANLRGETLSTLGVYVRSLRQFWEFGVSIVEKVVSWREGVPLGNFVWVGRDEVRQTLATGSGLIFVGAHVGNIEVIRALGETRQVVVNALMFTANSRHFRALLEKVNSKAFLRVIDISSMDPSLVFDLRERLRQGEIIALLADRAPKNSAARVQHVPFLSKEAAFPEGPWVLASLLEAPVFTVFSMRQKGGRYRVEFSRLADRILLPRTSRAEALYRYIAEYARRLGDIALRYPYQWFNFYPFWEREVATKGAETSQPTPRVAHERG